MKKGFTLIEILIMIVLVGGLAALAIPGFAKAKDKAAANQAITYLRGIRAAEKLYYAKNLTYVDCANAAAIRSTLGLEVSVENYTFAVDSLTATTFTATATRAGGGTITITEQGALSSGGGLPAYIDVPAF